METQPGTWENGFGNEEFDIEYLGCRIVNSGDQKVLIVDMTFENNAGSPQAVGDICLFRLYEDGAENNESYFGDLLDKDSYTKITDGTTTDFSIGFIVNSTDSKFELEADIFGSDSSIKDLGTPIIEEDEENTEDVEKNESTDNEDEWVEYSLEAVGLSFSIPKDAPAKDNSEGNTISLNIGLADNDVWIINMSIDRLTTNETLVNDPEVLEAIKTGLRGLDDLEIEEENIITIDDLIYSFTYEGETRTTERIMLVNNGFFVDMQFANWDSSEENQEVISRAIDSIKISADT